MNLHNSDRRRGITGVWVALMGSLMVVFLGLAIDTSYVVRTIDELQTAADSAALAGAIQVKNDVPAGRLAAQTLAAANTAGMTGGVRDAVVLALNSSNLPAGDIVTGRWYRWDDEASGHSAGDFDPTEVDAINAVKVVARRVNDADPEATKTSLPLLFGPVFGWDTVDLEVDAIAMVVGTTGAGLIVLCEDCECALKFGGTTDLTLGTAEGYEGDASIVVNSDATGCSPKRAAVCGSGGSLEVNAPEINIHAEGTETNCWSGDPVVPPINPGTPRVPDPLAGLPEPTINESADLGCIGGSGCDTKTCNGGLNNGLWCDGPADCPDDAGTCEVTSFTCDGGPAGDMVCQADADCEVPTTCDPVVFTCTAGPNAGAACASAGDCPNWTCSNSVMTCIDGPYTGDGCTQNGGECTNAGACTGAYTACVGGLDDGYHCNSHDDCSGGLCGVAPTLCHLGSNEDAICTGGGDCPDGSCVITIRVRPGYYSGGFRMNTGNLKLILDSGVYSLDNADGGPEAGLVINGGSFDATAGVMLHIVGDGVVHLAGSGDIWVSPITDETSLYWGVSIFQSRTNYNEAVIIGSTTMILEGTYYFPNNPVEIGGTGIAVGNQLIAHTLYLHGTGSYTINYDGRNPAPGYAVFLVE